MGARCILLRAKSFGMTRMAGIFATVDTTKFLANVLVSPPSVPKRMILCGFHYLQLHGTVGYDTFGFDRWLNQSFYQSREWRQFRDRIIVRDAGCDLACKDHEITDWVIRNGKPIRPRIIIHHLNPLTKEDVLQHTDALLDPENVICVSDRTHKAIHYGDDTILKPAFAERRPGDTCPWRK